MEFALRKARFCFAARAYARGEVAALEALLRAVLDAESTEEGDEDIRALMDLLQAARGGAHEAAGGGAAAEAETAPAGPAGSVALGRRAALPGLPAVRRDLPH